MAFPGLTRILLFIRLGIDGVKFTNADANLFPLRHAVDGDSVSGRSLRIDRCNDCDNPGVGCPTNL